MFSKLGIDGFNMIFGQIRQSVSDLVRTESVEFWVGEMLVKGQLAIDQAELLRDTEVSHIILAAHKHCCEKNAVGLFASPNFNAVFQVGIEGIQVFAAVNYFKAWWFLLKVKINM
jgi:hypothetical protein